MNKLNNQIEMPLFTSLEIVKTDKLSSHKKWKATISVITNEEINEDNPDNIKTIESYGKTRDRAIAGLLRHRLSNKY